MDKTTKEKIKRGEFVELEKLLPKNKFKHKSQDTKLEIIGKEDGQSYLVPLSERPNNNTISSFRQWDKAFRVYSGIYTKANPERADELLQYVNSTETAAETFAWDNVCAYDEVFRNLMEEYPREGRTTTTSQLRQRLVDYNFSSQLVGLIKCSCSDPSEECSKICSSSV